MSHYDPYIIIRGLPLVTYEFLHAQWYPSPFAHIAEGKCVRGLTYPQRSYLKKKVYIFTIENISLCLKANKIFGIF